MKFSVIIPMYNASATIADCVDSIARQQFPADEFEIIVVDDCSTDGSVNTTRSLICNYPPHICIKLVESDINRRQGGARNIGLYHAQGEYIAYVDADDLWVYDDVFKHIDDYISYNKDATIIRSLNCRGIAADYRLHLKSYGHAVNCLHRDTFRDFAMGERYGVCVWQTFYRRDILVDSGIRFREHVFFEDTDYFIKVAHLANRIDFVDIDYYGYRESPNSTTRRPNLDSFIGNILSIKATWDFVRQNIYTATDCELADFYRRTIRNAVFGWLKMSRNYPIRQSLYALRYARNLGLLNLLECKRSLCDRLTLCLMARLPIIPILSIKAAVTSKRTIKNLFRHASHTD